MIQFDSFKFWLILQNTPIREFEKMIADGETKE